MNVCGKQLEGGASIADNPGDVITVYAQPTLFSAGGNLPNISGGYNGTCLASPGGDAATCANSNLGINKVGDQTAIVTLALPATGMALGGAVVAGGAALDAIGSLKQLTPRLILEGTLRFGNLATVDAESLAEDAVIEVPAPIKPPTPAGAPPRP
jgi:hypothetical protein